jgi:hypothetical protein
MRSSLYWKYPVDSMLLFGHYFRERVRQKIRNIVAPAQPQPIPVAARRRRLEVFQPEPTVAAGAQNEE